MILLPTPPHLAHLSAHLGGGTDDDILEQQRRGRKQASGEPCLALPFCRPWQLWSPDGSGNGTSVRELVPGGHPGTGETGQPLFLIPES